MNFLIFFLLLVGQQSYAQSDDNIVTQKINLPNAVGGVDFEIQQSLVPERILPALVRKVVGHEPILQATLSYDGNSIPLLNQIKEETKNIPTRTFDERRLDPNFISRKEQNGMRVLLIIRCIGLGAGLYVGTGSSIAIAAYAGLFNYLLMEALYIPKRSGRMPGVDFILSFVNPGFWAGNLPEQIIVSSIGIGGFIAYFYKDIKQRPSGKLFCGQLFDAASL